MSRHRPGPTSPLSHNFTIYLYINLAVFRNAAYRLTLSVCRLPASLSFDLSVCQADPSSAASLFLSIHLNLCLSLFGGHWPSHIDHIIPSVSPSDIHISLFTPPCTPLDVETRPSISLSLINTDLYFDMQSCPMLQLSTDFVVFLHLSVHPSPFCLNPIIVRCLCLQ